MTTTGLQQGNWVRQLHGGNQRVQVCSVSASHINGISSTCFEPIPIEREWFEQQDYLCTDEWCLIKTEVLEIYIPLDGSPIIVDDAWGGQIQSRRTVHYIHEVQNFLLALVSDHITPTHSSEI